MRERWTILCLALLLGVSLAGCGGGSPATKVAVRGKIVNNGAPLTVQGQQVGVGRVEVHFVPALGGGAPRIALVHADGTFTLDEAGGFTAGKYKLAVYALEPSKDRGKAGPVSGLADQLQGAFSDKNTPIEREIAPGQDLGEIDLAKFATTPPAKS